MILYTSEIQVATQRSRQRVGITAEVRREVRASRVKDGICALFALGATAALMVQENDDPAIASDVLDCLESIAPHGQWRHDVIDNNGDAHIQAGIVGPSETLQIRDGNLALSTWQDIFLCDFDGPRKARTVLVTITGTARGE